MPPLSGLQREVSALYRRALRMAARKDPAKRADWSTFVRYTFRTRAESVGPRDVGAIEYLMRQGRKQLELYEEESVRNCSVTSEMRAWDDAQRRRSPQELQR
ncbi:hypothetical protein BD626DRAFT_504850 [Schizophyllum amplum]|uniref:Complex 1 LYR protein domain-containing protein n=1 Tax=Schizophyllum amplum TaxID=97359 RepID=A0A550C7A2_9AGAR|nr:hypothetical protein BD626DRAFT_504850 [Auriculariopsis ampla]